MTTDNPDPLEVWNKAVDAYDERLFGIPSPGTRADRTAARQAAAAIIAQHYAPVIAENERLRIIVGLHRNADAYDETFPDDEEDAKQLRKSATWHRLTARGLITDQQDSACHEAAKAWLIELPETKAVLEEARQALGAKP